MRCRSSDSTARIWEIPAELSASQALALAPKVLNHGAGPHKDVTTLEWNVRTCWEELDDRTLHSNAN